MYFPSRCSSFLPIGYSLHSIALACSIFAAQTAQAKTVFADAGDKIVLREGESFFDEPDNPARLIAENGGSISGVGTTENPIRITTALPADISNYLLYARNGGDIFLKNAQITASSEGTSLVFAEPGGMITLIDSVINLVVTPTNSLMPSTLIAGGPSEIAVSGSSITVTGNNAAGMEAGGGGHILFKSSTLNMNGGASEGITFWRKGRVTLQDSDISATGQDSNAVVFYQELSELSVENSNIHGDVRGRAPTVAGDITMINGSSLTGAIQGINRFRMADSVWTVTADSTLQQLEMDPGSEVVFAPGVFKNLSVDTLMGEGRFAMNSDISTLSGDLLNITGINGASGKHELRIADSGREPSSTDGKLTLVRTQGGNAQFTLAGGHVDVGVYRYGLVKENHDWLLASDSQKPTTPPLQPPSAPQKPQPPEDPAEPSRPVDNNPGAGEQTAPPKQPALPAQPGLLSAGANAVLSSQTALISVAQAAQPLLAGRMADTSLSSVWAKSYNGEYRIDNDTTRPFSQRLNGVVIGADTEYQWAQSRLIYGAMLGMSSANQDYQEGSSGKIRSQSAGLYTLWQHENGVWLAGDVQYHHLTNSLDIIGNLNQHSTASQRIDGWSGSVQGGKTWQSAQGWFVAPQAQLSALRLNSSHYSLDNGMEVKSEAAHSLQSRLALTSGKNIALDKGRAIKPYIELAWVNEFASPAQVHINQHALAADLPGDRAEVGVGSRVTLGKVHSISVGASYAKGKHIEQPWSATLSYQFSF